MYGWVRHPVITVTDTPGDSYARLTEMATKERANLFFGVCPRFGQSSQYDLEWQIRTVRVLWADLDRCTS